MAPIFKEMASSA